MAVKKRKTKTAKKKTTSTRKRKAPARRVRVGRITFKCAGGRCTASPRHPHIGRKGQSVKLEATNTGVDIDFKNGSPFSGSHFRIEAGDSITVEIANDSGEYEYKLTCDECSRRLAGPPSMIVD